MLSNLMEEVQRGANTWTDSAAGIVTTTCLSVGVVLHYPAPYLLNPYPYPHLTPILTSTFTGRCGSIGIA